MINDVIKHWAWLVAHLTVPSPGSNTYQLPPPQAGDDPNGCAAGLYIVTPRATGELQGIGITGETVGRMVANQINGSKIIEVEYPATMMNPAYTVSVGNGTASLTEILQNYHKNCPNNKIALMGYSQGAQVIMDTLCGSEGGIFDQSAPISSDIISSQVVAITLYGDPTHVPNLTFDRGSSTHDGIFPRKNSDNCMQYADLMASWCDSGDIFCDAGTNTTVHGQYLQKYGIETVKYVVDKYHAAIAKDSNKPSGTTKPDPTDASQTTATAAAATTSKHSAASATGVASGIFLALPVALLAMFQVL